MASIALALIGSAPTLIQGIASLIHGVENIFGHGSGAAKKAAVVQAFQAATATYNSIAGDVTLVSGKQKLPTFDDASIAAMGDLVDAIVAFYNATGLFTHTAAPAKK